MVNRKTPAALRSQESIWHGSNDTNDSFYAEDSAFNKRARPDIDEEIYPSPASDTASESDLQRLGRGVKDLISTINKLEVVGVEDLGLNLPKIIAVGDQSAGKSSLIEAISDIHLPRSSGTCTRCPIHITTEASDAESDEWVCAVSILKKYDHYKGHKRIWQPKDAPEKIPFDLVKDKTKLGLVIHQAQLAVLNPSKYPASFLTATQEDKAIEVEFSKNVVSLVIRGSNLPNLSFYDLPGIINQVENSKDEHLIDMVRELVLEHIESPEAIVLLACSMEGDIQNCNAARVVREADAAERCLCVLTKPDRIAPSESYDPWKAVLEGKKFPFGYGYHIVRNPAQNELAKFDHTEARTHEAHFFKHFAPWNTSGFSRFHQQFGTQNLQMTLSKLLTAHIRKALPEICQKVEDQLAEVEEELSRLPEPPAGDAGRHVHEILDEFRRHYQACIDGDNPDLKAEWESHIDEFANELAQRKPGINIQSKEDAVRQQEANKLPIEIDVEPPSTPVGPQSNRRPATPSTRGAPTLQQPNTPRQAARASLDPRVPRHTISGKKTFGLDEIRDALQKRSGSFIGVFEHPKAIETMIASSQTSWPRYVQDFYHATKTTILHKIEDIAKQVLKDRQDTELARVLPVHAREFLHNPLKDLEFALVRDLDGERVRPMIHTTFNRKVLAETEKEEFEIISAARLKVRQDLYWDETEPATGKVTSGAEREKKLSKAELERDPFEHELQVMAKVRGYYLVSAHRLVDTAARTVFNDLFEPSKRNMAGYLTEALGLYKPDAMRTCELLLADDPAKEERRQYFKQRKEKLDGARRQLRSLG